MLTKKLLRFRRVSGAIKPLFVDTESKTLHDLASSLIDIYDPELEPCKSDIEEQVMTLVNSSRDITMAKGLNKLLLDRSTFATPSLADMPTLREDTFQHTFEFFEKIKSAKREFVDLDELTHYVADKGYDQSIPLYSDLPEFETLTALKAIFPQELLERYNVSLVQSLLLNASSIDVIIKESDVSKLRKLFKYLKFFQLLATIELVEKTKKSFKQLNDENQKSSFKIKIDGPLSLFENTSKYGLRLASFFPVVCDMTKWKIKTNLKIDGKDFKLNVDEKSGLKCHYRNFSSYVPEEVRLFHKVFAEKSVDWKVGGATPFIRLKGQQLLFPDLCFTNKDGKTIYLELFHRWHYWQLKQHLEFLMKRDDIIIGIDRSLYKKDDVESLISEICQDSSRVFKFNSFPTFSAVDKSLAAIVDNCV